MIVNQLTKVDCAGYSHPFGRANRGGHRPAVRVGSQSGFSSSCVAILVMLALVGRDEPARGQAQGLSPADPAEPPAAKQPLGQRYRLLERYSAIEDPTRPELLLQYRVAIDERIKVTREKLQGDADLDTIASLIKYTERVTKVSKGSKVTEVVRRYDMVKTEGSLDLPHYKTKPLEGLSILYRKEPRSSTILCLTPGRQLCQQEYLEAVQQTFLPGLGSILPRDPSRVGDTWHVPREAAWALLGEEPTDERFDLTAEILEVHKKGAGPTLVAVIGVKGQVEIRKGHSDVVAQLQFTFLPAGRAQAAIDAKGYISWVWLAAEISVPRQRNDGPLKQTIRLERRLERRLADPTAEVIQLLEMPDPALVADESNSWLIYDDPQGQYHFLHPQEMVAARNHALGGVDLLQPRHDGPDAVHIKLIPKTDDPQRDRLDADPVQVKRWLEDDWKRKQKKIVLGASEWLPDADWAPLKRRVYLIEAALVPEDDRSPSSGRIYSDQYIVRFPSDTVMMVTAMTSSDAQLQFREKVEKIIKSFELGPSASFLPAVSRRLPSASPARGPSTQRQK